MSTKNYKRVFGIVMDSVGTGAAPDAAKFDDVGSDTLGHVGEAYKGKLQIPNLQKLGISNLRDQPIEGVAKVDQPIGYYGKMQEISAGKDSMDGHWEMMGLPVNKPLNTFPNGFPADILEKLAAFSGRKIIGNRPESGTKIIAELGEQQMKTGDLIVYTSGDSVLQIAAHEDVIPLNELYRICEYARTLVNGPEYTVGRIIARPYVGLIKITSPEQPTAMISPWNQLVRRTWIIYKLLAFIPLELARLMISSQVMGLMKATTMKATWMEWITSIM